MKRILNAGCGDRFEVGTDFIDLYPMEDGVHKIIKVNMNESRFPYPDNTFDQVYSRNVIAHISNPQHFLKECLRVLKKGGEIYLTTNAAAFTATFTHAFDGGYERIHGDLDRCYQIHTAKTLENTLEVAGFKDIRVEYTALKDQQEHSIQITMGNLLSSALALVWPKMNRSIVARAHKR